MESSFVLLKPHIHLFACTHPSVSNTLDCNDWLMYMHQSTSPLLKHVWIVVPCCMQASVSTLCFKHVWIMDPRLHTRIRLQPCVSNTFGFWFRVFVQAPDYSPSIKHVWIVVPSCIQASFPPCVSNAFGLWSLVCVHALVSNPVFLTRLDCGSLSVHTHLSTAL